MKGHLLMSGTTINLGKFLLPYRRPLFILLSLLTVDKTPSSKTLTATCYAMARAEIAVSAQTPTLGTPENTESCHQTYWSCWLFRGVFVHVSVLGRGGSSS